ncbi:MAG: pyridoxal-phosphate dependent enzyme [Propionibacteriaceae bacterium]|nr:pyridoxal-phosphate dependent enzyme [Propionibacteriaceae bacterium]
MGTIGPRGLLDTVAGTPLVPLTRLLPACPARLFAKLESFNPGGSAKDRSAHAMVADAWASGQIGPGSTLVESSSGNFAVALARLALLNDLHAVCVVDPRTNPATVSVLRALGAEVVAITEPDPETGDWLVARLARVRELVAERADAVWLDQYSHPAAVRAHADGTMREIDLALGGAVDWLFVATSTTGTIAGCLAHVERAGLPTRVVAVDAAGSVLFGGERGTRRLAGYGAGIVPALAEGLHPHEVVRVPDADAVVGTRALARREGILAGASAGAVAAAVARCAPRLSGTVALILHDGGLPYASTVFDDAWVESELGLTPAEMDARVAAFGEDA